MPHRLVTKLPTIPRPEAMKSPTMPRPLVIKFLTIPRLQEIKSLTIPNRLTMPRRLVTKYLTMLPHTLLVTTKFITVTQCITRFLVPYPTRRLTTTQIPITT
jgi:hypothetical protein